MNWYKERRAELCDGKITWANWPMWIVLGLFIAACNVISIAIVVAVAVGSLIGVVVFWLAVLTPYTYTELLKMIGVS